MILNKNKKLAWEKIISKLDDNERVFLELEKTKKTLDDLMFFFISIGVTVGFLGITISYISILNNGMPHIAFDTVLFFSGIIVMSSFIPAFFSVLKIEPRITKMSKTIAGV